MSEEEAGLPEGLPDFNGKVVAFYVADPTQALTGGVLLEYASFKRQGERLFVVGRVPAVSESAWVSNLPGGVAWDSVIHYLVFESREDYLTRGKHERGVLRRVLGR
jgi:hypothetical protein